MNAKIYFYSNGFYLFYLSFFSCFLQCSFSSSVSGFTSSMSGMGGVFKSIGTGMASQYQTGPDSYHSFKFVNNSNEKNNIIVKKIKMFAGAAVGKSTAGNCWLDIGEDTKNDFYHQKLFFDIKACDENNDHYYRKICNQVDPSDKDGNAINWYRSFSDESGLHGEFIGQNNVYGSSFNGMIYNATNNSHTITYQWGSDTYTIMLDPMSFNSLKVPQHIVFRPVSNNASDQRFFIVDSQYKLPIWQYGIETTVSSKNSNDNGSKAKQTISKSPMIYNYKIYENPTSHALSVYEVGTTPGMFQQPNTNRMRSITPINCFVWYQNASPQNSDTPVFMIPEKDPSHSMWCSYYAPGWSMQSESSVNGLCIYNVEYGKCISFNIIRPSVDAFIKISDNDHKLGITSKANLFVALLDTFDSEKAKSFMARLAKGDIVIPHSAVIIPPDVILKNQFIPLLQKLKTNTDEIYDSVTGIRAYIVIQDYILPTALDSGPYYYSIAPVAFYTGNMYQTISSYVKSLSGGGAVELANNIIKWINMYRSGDANFSSQLTNYLEQNGIDSLFESSDHSTWSSWGQTILNTIINGPTGFQNVPVLIPSGVNYYPYDPCVKPAIWADQSDVVSV